MYLKISKEGVERKDYIQSPRVILHIDECQGKLWHLGKGKHHGPLFLEQLPKVKVTEEVMDITGMPAS